MANSAPHSLVTRWVRGGTALAVAALALLLAATLWVSWRSSTAALAAEVDTDIAGLADIYASGGLDELKRRLGDRTALASGDGRQAHYLLGHAGEQMVGGDIARWPDLSPAASQAGFVTLADGTRVYARATRLAPELDLVVAREYGPDRAALARLAAVFVAAAAAIALAVWLIGRRAARRLARRIERITAAFRTAEQGDAPVLLAGQPGDELGELAQQSGQAIARLANLARTHRHMSDHIAHEIRTPLTHLDHRLVNCQRAAADPAARGELERCRGEIRGVVAMLDSLLDIAASEARVGDRSGLEEVDLSTLAENLVELYEGSAEEAGIALAADIAPGVRLPGEAMQLTRLISNLLDNALKYVPRGGSVRLAVRAGPVIEVSDDGPGVPAALRPFVFDRFRSGAANGDGRTSHGLGLALARAIALRHDLRIGLVDSPQGAHFVVQPHALWGREDEA